MKENISYRSVPSSPGSTMNAWGDHSYEVLAYWCSSYREWPYFLSSSPTMVARSYILDTRAVQRNSPLVLSALLTAIVKKHLVGAAREDLAWLVSTVTFFRDIVTIVTSKPIINFELRMYEGALKDILSKTLVHHGFDNAIHLHFR